MTGSNIAIEPDIRLKRRMLENLGKAVSVSREAVFHVEMPEEYRKKTLGYLMDKSPREVLGLPDFFNRATLKEAYRIKALRTHPDRGGSEESFRAVEEAYKRLSEGASLLGE